MYEVLLAWETMPRRRHRGDPRLRRPLASADRSCTRAIGRRVERSHPHRAGFDIDEVRRLKQAPDRDISGAGDSRRVSAAGRMVDLRSSDLNPIVVGDGLPRCRPGSGFGWNCSMSTASRAAWCFCPTRAANP